MIWVRRGVPMLIGAGLLYLGWRLVTANGGEVGIDLVVAQIPGVALWKALGAAFLSGVALVGVVLVVQILRSKLTLRRYRRELADLETEVHQLRNMPLSEGEPSREPVLAAAAGGEAVPR